MCVCNVYIKSSYFKGLSVTSSNDGGALYITGISKLLIELSTFIECEAPSMGAGIYMSGGQCILYRVCGVECEQTANMNGGVFSYVEVTKSANSINNIIETSVTKCKSEEWGFTVNQMYGHVLSKSVNLSQNYCYQCSALYCQPTYDGSNIVCSLCYSFLSNNTVVR